MNKFTKLNKTIIKCKKCSRLVKFRKKYHKTKENNSLMKNIGESPLQVLEI